MRVRIAFCLAVLSASLVPMLSAQDAVKVDPKHYSVVSENDQVRILKVHYGPHETSVMHSHPASVAVFLTDSNAQFTFPDGKTQPVTAKAGDSQYSPAQIHLPENTSDKAFEVIVVELKGKGAKPAQGTKKKAEGAEKK